MEVYG